MYKSVGRVCLFAFLLHGASGSLAIDLEPQAYALMKATYGYDVTYPLQVDIAGTLESDGYTFERIVFESFHDGKVTGLFAVPSAGEGPYPVVLLLHGITGNKKQWLDDTFTHGGDVTRGLLKAGYAVLALDAQYHGERAVYNNYIDPGEMVFRRGWGMRFANLLEQTVVDYRRAIDYLATRSEIDAQRVGVLGYSMGGHMSFILGAVEPRIRATVACVVPNMADAPMAPTTFARDMGEDPLLMMMARKDQFYTVDQAQALFDAVPGENKEIRFFDSGHSLPAAYAGQAVEWFVEQL